MRFHRWLFISLAIHAAVLSPLAVSMLRVEPPPRREDVKLDLELFGMLSERDVQETRKAGSPDIPESPLPPAPPTPQVAEKPPEESEPAPPPEPLPETAADVSAALPEDAPPPPDAVASPVVPVASLAAASAASVGATGSGAAVPSASTAGGGGGQGGRDATSQRGERSRRGGARAASPLDLYTSKVSRRLQSNLIYPDKMRRKGIEAVTTIAFTVDESGKIRRGSLEVRATSGYKELDENALKAARESSPFDKPPKELTLVIAVEFAVSRFK